MMSFKELIAEAAANKVPFAVTTREDGTSSAIIADFTPTSGAGREFTARIDHYTAQTINHGKFCKLEEKKEESKQPAAPDKTPTGAAKKTAAPAAPKKKVAAKTAAPAAKKAAAATKKTK